MRDEQKASKDGAGPVIFNKLLIMILIQIFNIYEESSVRDVEDLNAFIRSHRVIEIDKKCCIKKHGKILWTFCIKYVINLESQAYPKSKIDYKSVLSEEEFIKFSRLREIRKKIATDEGLPAFAIFTDEELSFMAKLEKLNIQSLKNIKGIGEKKASKFGHLIINNYTENMDTDK